MVFFIAALAGGSVILLTLAIAYALPGRPRAVSQRLAELQRYGDEPFGAERQRRRTERRQQLTELLKELGTRFRRGSDDAEIRLFLVQAGYRNPNAAAIYWGVRLGTASVLAILVIAIQIALGAGGGRVLITALTATGFGWVLPAYVVGRRRRMRQNRLQKALPDALDLLVVCVEAGLGLNQALVRVAEEIRFVSAGLSDELTLVNLEIRSGIEREDALRNLAERTGVDDIRSLTTILIQTERFGTSVATALRTQADTMRMVRRQRAEEQAAKATIKIVPPLVFFIFPAIFITILGPAVIQLITFFRDLNGQ